MIYIVIGCIVRSAEGTSRVARIVAHRELVYNIRSFFTVSTHCTGGTSMVITG